MRVGFVTCVQLGLHCLESVAARGGRFQLAITLPDDTAQSKSGRVTLDDFCHRTATPLLKVRNINDESVIASIRAHALDWLLIIGWSQIARAPVLGAARLGTLGMHPTLLPKGRGRAAIPWAILKGLTETGVTLFALDDGVDSGPIVAQQRVVIAHDETATTLYEKVSAAHVDLLWNAWDGLQGGKLPFTPQDHSQATVWPGRKPDDGRIAADSTLADAERLVRAVTHPYPGAFFETDAGRVRIWRATADPRPNHPSTLGFDVESGRIRLMDGDLRLWDWAVESR